MTAFKIADFASVCIQDAQGTTLIQNPHLNLVILDHSHKKTLTPGQSYLVTISQIQSTPDVVIEPTPEGDNLEEHI